MKPKLTTAQRLAKKHADTWNKSIKITELEYLFIQNAYADGFKRAQYQALKAHKNNKLLGLLRRWYDEDQAN